MGVRCIGVPIWDHTGQVIAGLTLSGPTSRMSYKRIETELLPLILEAGAEISRRLGYDQGKSSFTD
jgi:DNA-binding IclR family transcriptional regulator